MDAWIIILAIALLRGLGAWYNRRQKQQRQAGSPDAGQRRPVPGDPDAFDVEEVDPLESEWTPPWEPSPPPPPRPSAPGPSGREATLTEEERQRQAILRRLARAADEMAQASAAMETPALAGEDRPHPHAGRGARISHLALGARNLQVALRSPRHLRQSLLLNEVLGLPVAMRGPLRRPGSQPR